MRYFFIINFGDRAHCTESYLNLIKSVFKKHNKEYFIAKSKSIDHSKELINKAVEEKYDALLIGGGDGTINSILNFSMNKNISLGLIPLGSLNCLVRYLKIPLDPLKAIEENISIYTPKKFDVGFLNNKAFISFASSGYDAYICHKINRTIKIYLKRAGFILTGFANLHNIRELPLMNISINNGNIITKGYCILLSNIDNYADRKFFQSTPFDGKMQCIIIKNKNFFDYTRFFFNALISPNTLSKKLKDIIEVYDFNQMEITSDKQMYFQVDGEAVSMGDNKYFNIKMVEKAISILCNE